MWKKTGILLQFQLTINVGKTTSQVCKKKLRLGARLAKLLRLAGVRGMQKLSVGQTYPVSAIFTCLLQARSKVKGHVKLGAKAAHRGLA